MDCRYTLVQIYLFVCRRYRAQAQAAAERQSNNSDPDFTDEEVVTVYLFGIAEQCKTVSESTSMQPIISRSGFPTCLPTKATIAA